MAAGEAERVEALKSQSQVLQEALAAARREQLQAQAALQEVQVRARLMLWQPNRMSMSLLPQRVGT